jgi:hypothetical protein
MPSLLVLPVQLKVLQVDRGLRAAGKSESSHARLSSIPVLGPFLKQPAPQGEEAVIPLVLVATSVLALGCVFEH